MGRSFADMKALILQHLQDTGAAEFAAGETTYEMVEALKEFGSYPKHENLVPITYKIESRTGAASATSSGNLTDTTKSQFIAGDATDEKVVHNTNDDTWATIGAFTSTSVLALSKDIFVSGENYEIFNKRCYNNRQIWIGDVTTYLRIARVEYPVGRPRDFKLRGNNVLEIDVASVDDSNPTLSTLGRVDAIVWFAKPHLISQLTDWAGEATANTAAGSTTLAIDGMAATEVIGAGEMFYIENQRTLYTVTTDVTTSANAATLSIFPALEAAVVDNDDVTFVKSTLLPDDEDIFAELVTARLSVYHAPKFFKAIGAMGQGTAGNYSSWGERRYAQVTARLRGETGAQQTIHHPRY